MHRTISILSLLVFTSLLSDTSARLTLLITGHSSFNVDKHQLARQFVESYDEIIKESSPELSIFTSEVAVPIGVEAHTHGIWDEIQLADNVTTLIVTNLDIEEMNTDHVAIMQRLLDAITPLVVIEFGDASPQTRALLDETTECLLSGYVANTSSNVVYFCNSASPAMLSSLRAEDLHNIKLSAQKKKPPDPQPTAFWPWIFASAAKERRHHEHHHHHDHHHPSHHGHYHHHHRHHFNEDVDEIVDQIMEQIVEQGAVPASTEPVKEASEYEKKLGCKYRKSCYETGTLPETGNVLTRFIKRWWPHWIKGEVEEVTEEKADEQEEKAAEPFDAEADILPQKVRCKYRITCYHDRGIPYDEKAEERRKILLSSKRTVQSTGQKKTLKEIAAFTLQKVQEAEEKAVKRPVVNVVTQRLNAIEEKLNEKLNCKYRKSCYETGQKPIIADGWSLPIPIKIFSTEPAEAATKELNYDELEELEKKVYCKYRKSCYETGNKPDIEPEILLRTFPDLFTIHQQVEPRKMTLQEKCKYRKSCYETGIVPEINPKLEEVIRKEVSAVIPTNEQDLRLFCKYRKSCYAEVHDSATVDTIKFLRKRRQIEKEVRRRRAKRAKLHRRLRGELQLDSYRSKHYHPHNKAKQEERLQEPEDIEEIVDVKIIPQKRGRKEKGKEKKEDAESVPDKTLEYRKSKQRQQRADSEEKTVIDEPVRITTTEAEDDTLQAKKSKKGKKPKAEEPKVEKKVEKKLEKEKEKEEEKEEANMEEKQRSATKLKKKKETETKPKEDVPKQKERKEKDDKKPDDEQQREAAYEKQAGSKRFDKVAAGMKKMIEDMHQQQEIQQKKEYCKYRKSCYKSGKKPKIDQSLHHIFGKTEEAVLEKPEESEESITKKPGEPLLDISDEEMEKRNTREAHAKIELAKKLECKYRKSCYETGVLPEIFIPHYFYNDQKIVFKAGVSKQLQCKYRKSCYAETGLLSEKEDLKDAEDKREKKLVDQKAKHTPSSEDDRDDKDDQRKSFKSAQTATGPAARSTDKETLDVECKSGGKSCYSSAEPQAMNEDHAGNVARIGLERYRKTGWCNKYYYSCRAILGLPPKERAPIGPNGRRLCRKKPL
ncbi:hypothetical protein GCK32_017597 [Trichostrongylus colubriformis]|uniref:Uncharacterized protein n=1 Tax=Trichostrongylus colubriformis TaxID=6319 RepID=A0AAN8EYL4_TRICO